MKRKITITVMATLFLMYANAQVKYGVRAGVNMSNWKGDAVNSLNKIVDVTNGFITTKGKTGLYIGSYASIPVAERFSIEPGIGYSQKGYSMTGDLKIDALKFLGANASAKVQSDYIDIPVMLKAEVAKGLSIYAGPQVSILAHSNLKLAAGILGINLYNNKLDITNQFNKTDVAVAGGVGYKFDNGLNIAAGYDYGLSKVDNSSNFKAYNRVVKVSLGFTF